MVAKSKSEFSKHCSDKKCDDAVLKHVHAYCADASKKRREELEKWLKKKEEQKKKEALCQKKPFYAGSAMVTSIGKFGYSVKPHACAHGSKASSGGGKEAATAPQQQTKPTAGNKNKATTGAPQNR